MTTKRSELRSKEKLKDPEMARCSSKSETQPLGNGLGANADAFIESLDFRHRNIKMSLQNCKIKSKRIDQFWCVIGGFLCGGSLVFVLVCYAVSMFVQQKYSELLFLICLVLILAIALPIIIILADKSDLDDINSNIRDFRKTVFRLVIELGKLKQRCEDLRPTSGLGFEKENLKRLEESIDELLCEMEALTDTATRRTVAEVQEEYGSIFNQLEKMKVRLSFYKDESCKTTSRI